MARYWGRAGVHRSIGTVIFATMLSVHTGSSVPAHSRSIESQYQVAQAHTQEESDNLNVATCDEFDTYLYKAYHLFQFDSFKFLTINLVL